MTRSVVVTGANSGIGLATALELARHGFDVVGTVRSPEKGEGLVAAAAERGTSVRYVICDVASSEQTTAAFAEITELTGGGPWAVVNNAGYPQPGAVEDVDDELARAQLEVNVLAPARIARLVLPAMRERGDGRIVMMSSVSGRMTFPLLGWYNASKHALESLTDALRMEVAGFGVKVVLVEPGNFGTRIWAEGLSRVPDRPGSPYAPLYHRGTRHADKVTRVLPDPVWVARVVRLALTSRRPLRRYAVGIDATVGLVLDSLAPEFVADAVKRAGVGLLGGTHRRGGGRR